MLTGSLWCKSRSRESREESTAIIQMRNHSHTDQGGYIGGCDKWCKILYIVWRQLFQELLTGHVWNVRKMEKSRITIWKRDQIKWGRLLPVQIWKVNHKLNLGYFGLTVLLHIWMERSCGSYIWIHSSGGRRFLYKHIHFESHQP